MASKDLPPQTNSWWSIFFKSQLSHKPRWLPQDTNLSGQVVVITGGNTGLGFESARQFLSFQLSHLIITSRSAEKGKVSASKLQAEYPSATIQVWPLDMCSYDSIQAFVDLVQNQLPRLDIAVLNAGLIKPQFDLVATGHEEMMQVNYLSTALLAILLLPILKSKSPLGVPGKLSIVNSGTSLKSTFPNSHQPYLLKSFDDTQTAPPVGFSTYAVSKLMGHMFLYKLVDYVSAEDVIVNLVDPGLTRGTDFTRTTPKVVAVLAAPIMNVLARNPTDGASTYLDSTLARGKESHGCFIMDWEIRPFAPILYTTHGKDTIEKLWRETLDELEFARVRSILESLRTV